VRPSLILVYNNYKQVFSTHYVYVTDAEDRLGTSPTLASIPFRQFKFIIY